MPLAFDLPIRSSDDWTGLSEIENERPQTEQVVSIKSHLAWYKIQFIPDILTDLFKQYIPKIKCHYMIYSQSFVYFPTLSSSAAQQQATRSAQNIFHSKLTAVNFFQGVYNYV